MRFAGTVWRHIPKSGYPLDAPVGVEACRRIADWARQKGYVAIRAPSAADDEGVVLAIYPDMRPASNIELANGPDRTPINYGDAPLVDRDPPLA